MKIIYKQIGVIHSPFLEPKGVPIQPSSNKTTEGVVEVFKEYQNGLKDLEEFSHIILIYHFHLIKEHKLLVKPFMDDNLHGVFSTRAPSRPNPIGISVVKLEKIKENKLYVKNIDIVDGTPLIDIKPYVPQFNLKGPYKIGWLNKEIHKLANSEDDGRFL